MKNHDRPMNIAGTAAGGGGSAPARTGQLEVALAVARVSALVTVDPSQTPFKTVPAGLFLRTFGDAKIGITDEQMIFFKARLKALLPEIGATVDGIAEDATQTIGAVAQIVALAEASLAK
jgi:hypothetical protein